jgi:hypothetical protein
MQIPRTPKPRGPTRQMCASRTERGGVWRQGFPPYPRCSHSEVDALICPSLLAGQLSRAKARSTSRRRGSGRLPECPWASRICVSEALAMRPALRTYPRARGARNDPEPRIQPGTCNGCHGLASARFDTQPSLPAAGCEPLPDRFKLNFPARPTLERECHASAFRALLSDAAHCTVDHDPDLPRRFPATPGG